jgi:ABC-2 type transport system ATP-binding protein
MDAQRRAIGEKVDPELQVKQEDVIVHTEGLTKRFGAETAVDALTLRIPRGRIFGLIGPSGCGKTTTVRLLTGVYAPTEGRAVVLGLEPSRFSQTARTQIGYMPQHSILYPNLTVWENLRFAGSIYGVRPFAKRQLLDVLEFVELEEHRQKRVRQLSGGMQRRLSLANSLIHQPTLLFLDEPTGGVDPVLRRKFWDHFETLRDEGRTLLVTTQYVGEAAYCDLVGVMMAGSLVVVDTPEGLRRRAFGGTVINLETRQYLEYSMIQALRQIDGLEHLIPVSNTQVRLVVDDASQAIPRIIRYTKDLGIDVESVREYRPPYDDVFVRLVQGKGARQRRGWGTDA